MVFVMCATLDICVWFFGLLVYVLSLAVVVFEWRVLGVTELEVGSWKLEVGTAGCVIQTKCQLVVPQGLRWCRDHVAG